MSEHGYADYGPEGHGYFDPPDGILEDFIERASRSFVDPERVRIWCHAWVRRQSGRVLSGEPRTVAKRAIGAYRAVHP